MMTKAELLNLLSHLPTELSSELSEKPRALHAPISHLKALDLGCPLVTGIRGAGKTFWVRALTELKGQLLSLSKQSSQISSTECIIGFSELPVSLQENNLTWPSSEILSDLVEKEYHPSDIWLTIVTRLIIPESFTQQQDWQSSLIFYKSNRESIEKKLRAYNAEMAKNEQHKLVLFDALERTGRNRETVDRLLSGLLAVLITFRTKYSNIHLKAFVRPDRLTTQVVSIPDWSKLDQLKVPLTWPPRDLFLMAWAYLANTQIEEADAFRENTSSTPLLLNWEQYNNLYVNTKKPSDDNLRQYFHSTFTGPWMGTDGRRGTPYTWLPNHLADSLGQVSPRSFLTAIREASVDSEERYPKYKYPLHYESIKRGVQKASQIRVTELDEDFPWVRSALMPLQGCINVPVQLADILRLWKRDKIADTIILSVKRQFQLPAADLDNSDYQELARELQSMGIFRQLPDRRIDIPDVYRVAFGIGRKGGVRPLI